jgi:hypothetical protein
MQLTNKEFIEYRHDSPRHGCDRPDFVRFYIWSLNAPTYSPHLIYIYSNNQNMIVVVAVQPNVILGRQYTFAPQTEPSIFIFWHNMTCCSKTYRFSTALKLPFKEIFAKGETYKVISCRGSPLSALRTDRRRVKSSLS